MLLAGGLGTRLGEIAIQTPKPLAPAGGVPFLDHLVWNLGRFGIRRIVISAGYLAQQMLEYAAKRPHGIDVEVVVEPQPLGTGGGLRQCLDRLDETVLVLNGDTLFDVNYFALTEAAQASGLDAAIALRSVDDVARYGAVQLDGSRITAFAEKSSTGPGLINAGIYLFRRASIAMLPKDRKISLETDVIPSLVASGVVAGVPLSGYFVDIGLKESLAQADRDLSVWRLRPIAFLDRDGVLNEDTGYLHQAKDCRWIEGAPAAVRRLNETGHLVILVTNQAGIARGYYDEATFHDFMNWYQDCLAEAGAHLDDIYFSPYHPTEGKGRYLRDADCRKPNPGMLTTAFKKWPHTAGSFLIGNQQSDLDAARRAGIMGYLFQGGNLEAFVDTLLAKRGQFR